MRCLRPIIWHPCVKAAQLFMSALIFLICICIAKASGSSVIANIKRKVDTPLLCMNVIIQPCVKLIQWSQLHFSTLGTKVFTSFGHRNTSSHVQYCFLDIKFVPSVYLPRGSICASIPPSFLHVITVPLTGQTVRPVHIQSLFFFFSASLFLSPWPPR